MKKHLAVFIVAVISTALFFSCSLNPTISGFKWKDNNGEITITGYEGQGGKLTIPGKINGKPVTAIGDNAFNWGSYDNFFDALISVSIPESVTSIGESAFESNCLTTVIIPKNVTSIGDQAFIYNLLTSVTIPESITAIGRNVFHGNNLNSVTIGANVPLFYSITDDSDEYETGFEFFYISCDYQAGTYIKSGDVWKKK